MATEDASAAFASSQIPFLILSNRAIAARLVLGEETIKSDARAIYRKLGVSDRAQAVGAALREGVFT